ncbi:MAG TPA: STAS domain-containing protein [Ramlibacter sp.]|nr:STAS domain-containing protein [Ramlibacter sp.]
MSTPKGESNGLLSKVVKFVRNPTSWSELDTQDDARESGYSKQMLKEMIERKRRNDFVRKREFDMLRKMRRSEALSGHDAGARPSFFQSSMPSRPDDRASTLKKIDEIEAQMSQQWWKTRNAVETSTRTDGFAQSAHIPPNAAGRPSRPPGPPPVSTLGRATSYLDVDEPMLNEVMPKSLAGATPGTVGAATPESPKSAPLEFAPMRAQQGAPMRIEAVDSGSPASGFMSPTAAPIKVSDAASESDPDLEEAAIRFASGDDASAEAGLLAVLGPGGARVKHEPTWLALFDLYRATGQQARFDEAAIDFAGRFARSAPQWLSFASLSGQAMPAPAAGGASADWNSPASFGPQTLTVLQTATARAAQPWRLSWERLTVIEDAAAEGLARLFAHWASQSLQIHFAGAAHLERVLKAHTFSGDRAVDPAWWKLRLETLRLMNRPDEFELAALDYCVTYEVSPPSWERPRCRYKSVQADGSEGEGHSSLAADAFTDSEPMGRSIQPHGGFSTTRFPGLGRAELAGTIVGDAVDLLRALDTRLIGAPTLVISCARLVRIDFSAAGAVLNWVSAHHEEGRQVQFTDTHRLIAGFFNVVGINGLARVLIRRD